MTDSPTTTWYTEHRQVLDFARILADAAVLTSATDALDYLAEPQHFDTEDTLWAQLAHPRPPSTDDLDEARLLGHTSPRAIALRQQHQGTSEQQPAYQECHGGKHSPAGWTILGCAHFGAEKARM